jgi:CelD/BcsL family acetyltransferase involved in cellulose biosynthesis
MIGSQTCYSVSRADFKDEKLRSWWSDAYHANRIVRNTFFQSWEWNSSWFDHFVRDDVRRELVLLRIEKEGSIVAAVPLFLQKRNAGPLRVWRYFLWLADGLSQYPDLISTETDTETLWRAIMHYLHREFADAWLTLHDVLPESTVPVMFASPGKGQLPGELYLRLLLETDNEDDFLQRCVPHLRRNIQRTRRFLEQNPQVRWNAYPAPGADLVERMISLSRQRFGGASWFADENSAAFFRSLCSQIGNELLISVISEDDCPVHIIASYLHGGTLHYVLSGMDDRAKRWRPGIMNLDCTIRWAAREGYRYFDFLRGDDPYKLEFNPEQRMSIHLTIPPADCKARFRFARLVQRANKAVNIV